MKAAPFGRSGLGGLAALFVPMFLAVSCGATPQEDAAAQAAPVAQPVAEDPPAPAASGTGNPFAVEEALGASCRPNFGGDPPLQHAACYGRLPEHLQSLLRNLPDTHPHLSRDEREEAASKRQWFRAVSGYGARPDFLTSILDNYSTFWIRSFEGTESETTVYVVYGPACSSDPALSRHSIDEGCLPGAPAVMRALRIYRVRGRGPPEEVTTELAPPAPTLAAAERARYGVYLRPPEEGEAVDTDIGLDVGRLDTTPVMRWVINPPEEGDYERPRIPDSDPRGFFHQAHFGFLVWTGERFELRERIPLRLWVCGVAGPCDARSLEGYGDPWLTEDGASDLAGRSVP